MLQTRPILFYDSEVFKEDIIFVFKDQDKNTVAIYHNDFVNPLVGSGSLHELVASHTLYGYNNYHYDDYILSRALMGWNNYQIKLLNDTIIGNQPHVEWLHPILDSRDVFQQIHISYPSLKKLEANMGLAIVESEVSFDLDRKLNQEELEESIHYCSYDVDALIEVWKKRKDYFVVKEALVEQLGDARAIKWNTTTISTNIITEKNVTKWSSVRIPDWVTENVPREVADYWNEIGYTVLNTTGKTKVEIEDFGNKITFGEGGLHSDPGRPGEYENVYLADVASMYPHIVVKLDILGSGTKFYQDTLQERLAIKRQGGNPETDERLKLILNSVYGQLGLKYSKLFNPKALQSVTFTGQSLIYTLAKRLAPYAEIIQTNTDGVAFKPLKGADEAIRVVLDEWEQEFDLSLGVDRFKRFIQSNVNVYIAETYDGKIKTKGAGVKNYRANDYFSTNNTRIVDIAAVNYLLYGTSPIKTILENVHNPLLFQYVLQAGKTYVGTIDSEGKMYQKVNRVFAVKESVEGVTELKKLRPDNGTVKFANAPLNMKVWNYDVSEYENFPQEIDITHYVERVNAVVEYFRT